MLEGIAPTVVETLFGTDKMVAQVGCRRFYQVGGDCVTESCAFFFRRNPGPGHNMKDKDERDGEKVCDA